jgi:spore germination cell wall hydrolase CwlJ-like protein
LLVTIGLLLSIFEITTFAAERPIGITANAIGLRGALDLPGVEFSEALAKPHYTQGKNRGIETESRNQKKGNISAGTHIKELVLGYTPVADIEADARAPKFIHAEGIVILPEKYTDDEKNMIARVVYAEARGESFEGKVAVAQVILNRYESGKFGKSIKSVVFSRHQFAVSKRYDDACLEAVEYAIDNSPYPKNMYYFQKSKRKNWHGKYFDRIGNHSFYCGKW